MESWKSKLFLRTMIVATGFFCTISFADTIRLETKGKWIGAQKVNPMDDSSTVLLSLKANNEVKGWLSSETPSLLIRCLSNKTDLYFSLGMQTSVETGNFNASTITLRLDKNKPFKLVADKSTDNKSLFVRRPISLLKQIMEAEEMLLQFVPFNASQVVTSFTVSGLKESIGPLRKICKW